MTTRKKPESRPAGIGRRDFMVKGGGAVAAAAATSTLGAPAVHAADTVKIGMVSPQTGPIAAFGETDRFVLAEARKTLKNGIKIGGKTWQVEIIDKDSQSNPNRAAAVAQDLILKDEVNLMIGSSSAVTVNPVADQCEANEVPCVTSDTPLQVVFFGRGGNPKKGFKWTYHFFWGIDDAINVFQNMWNEVGSNKKLGALMANDGDGVVAGDPKRGFKPPMEAAGFKYFQRGLFNPGSTDFTSQIDFFKKEGIELLTGVATPPDWSTFWGQAAQQGLTKQLRAATIAKALLFPAAVEALGDRGAGLTTEVWWSPSHPFKSGLNGKSASEFAADYTAATGKQWTQPMGFKHANIEVAIDVLKRCEDPRKPENILRAIKDTNYNSIVGPVSWKFGDRRNPLPNMCRTPLVGGQWVKGKKFKYDLVIVSNKSAPEIKTGAKIKPLAY